MKASYAIKLDNRYLAVCDVVPIDFRLEAYLEHDVRWVITRINVPLVYRNQGIATRMLTSCCMDADVEDATLWLEFSPYTGTHGPRLHKLYTRCGFQDVEELPGLMKREPVVAGMKIHSNIYGDGKVLRSEPTKKGILYYCLFHSKGYEDPRYLFINEFTKG